MVQYAVRFLIAAIVFAIFVLILVPGLLGVLNFPAGASIELIFKGVAILVAFGYIIWGPPVPGVPGA